MLAPRARRLLQASLLSAVCAALLWEDGFRSEPPAGRYQSSRPSRAVRFEEDLRDALAPAPGRASRRQGLTAGEAAPQQLSEAGRILTAPEGGISSPMGLVALPRVIARSAVQLASWAPPGTWYAASGAGAGRWTARSARIPAVIHGEAAQAFGEAAGSRLPSPRQRSADAEPAAPRSRADAARILRAQGRSSSASGHASKPGPRSSYGGRASMETSFPAGRGPSPRAVTASKAAARRSSRPRRRKLSLSRLLGRGALRPPRNVAALPARNPWPRPLPRAPGPDPVATRPVTIEEAEDLSPPTLACRKKAAHWHAPERSSSYFHDGKLWGLRQEGPPAGDASAEAGRHAAPSGGEGRESWFERSGGRWWLWPGEGGPLLWHQSHWWSRQRGLWFLLHQGEPWGYRRFAEWGLEGLSHSSGARLVYSSDGRRLALILPGAGAAVFDAHTGAELGRWSKEDLPKPRARQLPAAPSF